MVRRRAQGLDRAAHGASEPCRRREPHADGRRQCRLSVRVDRRHPAGPQVPRRRDLVRDRRPQPHPRAGDDPPRDLDRWREDHPRRWKPADGGRAHRARLPAWKRDHDRERRAACRTCACRNRRHDRRKRRVPPLRHRRHRVAGRRACARLEGCSAVSDRRGLARADPRSQPHPDDPPRIDQRGDRGDPHLLPPALLRGGRHDVGPHRRAAGGVPVDPGSARTLRLAACERGGCPRARARDPADRRQALGSHDVAADRAPRGRLGRALGSSTELEGGSGGLERPPGPSGQLWAPPRQPAQTAETSRLAQSDRNPDR